MTSPRPAGLGIRAQRFWRAVVTAYELSDGEGAVLVEACRTIDLVDRLAAQLASEELTIPGSRDQPVLNPLAAELRQQRDLLGRLLSRLALPGAEESENAAVLLGRRGAAARWHRPKG